MPITWPVALPALPIESSLGMNDNFIVTETDAGPRKKRRRYTAASKFLSVRNWHLYGNDFETLLDFYEVQTRAGSDAFTIPSAVSGMASSSARFASTLGWSVIVPSEHAGRRLFRVDFELEVLP